MKQISTSCLSAQKMTPSMPPPTGLPDGQMLTLFSQFSDFALIFGWGVNENKSIKRKKYPN
jgi:hypothetical protein